jgi:chromosome partitioning protein
MGERLMLIIACLSQKGGVGKSTLSRLIARTYAQAGWRVKIADFNAKQKTSVDWAAIRLAENLQPEIAAETFSSVKSALNQDYDLMVFDGKPDADAITLDIAKEAALIVIPTSTSADDLVPQVKFAHELRSRGVNLRRLLFVLNKTGDSKKAIADAREYLTLAGYDVVEGDLSAKTGYEMAQNTGRALSESDFSTLNDRADRVVQQIVDRATQLGV